MKSLRSRLLLSSIIVFVTFVGLTGYVIDRAFYEKTKASLFLRLQGQIFDLLRMADLDEDGKLVFPSKLNDLHLMQPKSGHYAAVAYKEKIIWFSPSNHGVRISYQKSLQPGQRVFSKTTANDDTDLYVLSLGYVWIDEHDKRQLYVFNVAESDHNFNNEILTFRHGLWTWLAVILVGLFVTQGFILSWGLRPLAKVRKELADIEEGKREFLDSNSIEEIKDLTSDLNTLLRFERSRQERYKNSLGDLAHSFKTPLAIIKSILSKEGIDSKLRGTLEEQADTLNELVTYQLRRAQTAGSRASLSKPVVVHTIVDKITNALSKVYTAKDISVTKNVSEECMFYGDDGDLLEVLGNLLDNAHKWCNNRVQITASFEQEDDGILLTLIVEDDGNGIADKQKKKILQRGVRADQKTPGHGIGMSIITEIISAYCGTLEVKDSELGGAKFIVRFKH